MYVCMVELNFRLLLNHCICQARRQHFEKGGYILTFSQATLAKMIRRISLLQLSNNLWKSLKVSILQKK